MHSLQSCLSKINEHINCSGTLANFVEHVLYCRYISIKLRIKGIAENIKHIFSLGVQSIISTQNSAHFHIHTHTHLHTKHTLFVMKYWTIAH